MQPCPNKRLEQARAEVTLLELSVQSYRKYQKHELDEVRLCCARLCVFLERTVAWLRQATLADDKDVIEEHSGARRSCASHVCVQLVLCRGAGLEGVKANVMTQFANPMLSDEEEDEGDGKDGGAAGKK